MPDAEHWNDDDDVEASSGLLPATTTMRRRLLERLSSLFGIFCLVLSAFCFSIMTLLVSLAERLGLPATELLMARALFQFAVGPLMIAVRHYAANDDNRPSYWLQLFGLPSQRLWLVLRGGVGALALFFFYMALRDLPLSDASFLSSTTPVWTGILAALLLGEQYIWLDFLAALSTVAGVLFIAHPAFIFGTAPADASPPATSNVTASAAAEQDGSAIAGMAFALLSAFSAACVYVLIRKMGDNSSADCQIFYWGFAGLLLAPPLMLLQGDTWLWPDSVRAWLYVLGIAVLAYLSQYFFNVGTQREKASIASSVRNVNVLFTLIWQLLVLGIPPFFGYSLLGGALIFCAVVGLSVYKVYITRSTALPDTQPAIDHSHLDREDDTNPSWAHDTLPHSSSIHSTSDTLLDSSSIHRTSDTLLDSSSIHSTPDTLLDSSSIHSTPDTLLDSSSINASTDAQTQSTLAGRQSISSHDRLAS